MNVLASLSKQPYRQTSAMLLLLLLLATQLLAAVHGADLDAHDSDSCEICLVKNSSDDDDFVVACEAEDYFHHTAALNARSIFNADSCTPQKSHLIRAPPR